MTTGYLRAFLRRAVLMGVLWIVLAGWATDSWALAALIVGLASYSSLRAVPPGTVRIRTAGLARFIPFFLVHSARGGVDVALRAVRRSPDLQPGTIELDTALPAGPSRSFYVAVIGLLPGTLTARLEGARVEIHVLDRRNVVVPRLRTLEARVGELFGVALEAPEEPRGAVGHPDAPRRS